MNAEQLARIAAEEMHRKGLAPAFAPAVLQEAAAIAANHAQRGLPVAPQADVRDLRRGPLWFSIDNDDTRDLDQLSWAEALPDGGARLVVAIADVAAFVAPGGAIDRQAAQNTTSVYTAAGTFPMLPTVLSTDLTSLHEGRERLAVVVDMTIAPDGLVAGAELYRAVVQNHARLTYDGVAAWLDGEQPDRAPPAVAASAALREQLRLHERIATTLRQWRYRRGALNVTTAQARPVFDADGRLVDLRADRKNRAKDLIADLMIATNGATARHLAQRGYPSLRRVLQQPRRWDRIVALAASHGGHVLPPQPDAPALDRFLTERRQAAPDAFEELSLAIVKSLGSGAYAAVAADAPPAGHFGLAVNDYAHSTAPNRRFVDLATQRLLQASLAGEAPPYSLPELEAIAAQCTLQEDAASSVERRVLKAAAAHLLHDRVGATFDAIVTGVTPKGTFVRILSPLVEGRVLRGFEGLDVGDALKVRLLAVDPEQRFIDFARA